MVPPRGTNAESPPLEKHDALHLEYGPVGMLSHDDETFLANFTDEAKRKVLKKVCLFQKDK